MEFAAAPASPGTESGACAGATCTGAVSGGSTCAGSVSAATTIESGSTDATGAAVAAVVSVVVPVITGSAVVATSGSSTALLAIVIAPDASASSALAEKAGAPRSMIGSAPLLSMSAEPKPASPAMTKPARKVGRRNAAETIANRREFMIPASKGSTEPDAQAKHATRPDCSDHDANAQWRKMQVVNFSEVCCRNATRRRSRHIDPPSGPHDV